MIHKVEVDFRQSRYKQLRLLQKVPQFIATDGTPQTGPNQFFVNNTVRWATNTIKTYAGHADAFLNWLYQQRIKFEDCNKSVIDIYIAALCSDRGKMHGLTWNTISSRARFINALMIWSLENHYLSASKDNQNIHSENPRGMFQRFSHPRRAIKREIRWVRLEIALQMIHSIENKTDCIHRCRDGLIARLMLEVGLRVTEAVQFPISSLPKLEPNKEFAVTTVTGKGRKERIVLIPSRLVRALWGYVENERQYIVTNKTTLEKIPDALFLTASCQPPGLRWIEKIFRRYSAESGNKITPHTLRHTFGTYHYYFHKDLALLKSLMGHSQLETTETYYVQTAVLSGYSKQYAEMLDSIDKNG